MNREEICRPGESLPDDPSAGDIPQDFDPAVPAGGLLSRLALADWLLVGFYVLTGFMFVLAPVLAYSWQSESFPGFVIEQTLVVSDYNGYRWNGRAAGIGHPQRVIALDGRAIKTSGEFQSILSSQAVGEQVDVSTILPTGERRSFTGITLQEFPAIDLLRLFWIPYLVGLAYLILGAWAYRLRGQVNSGRAFAFFCACAALASGLLFDLISTHVVPAIWTLAMALQGGALVSLAFHFPEERGLFEHRKWLRYVPFLISLALVGWGFSVLFSARQPWGYIHAWRFNYIYTAFGIVFFLGMMLYRLRSEPSQLVRQQIKVILWGGLVAFIPVGIWLAAPLFGIQMAWNPMLFLPALLFFPLSVGVAVARYRLWDLDLLINRTLVYSSLTFLLGGIFLITVVVLQQLFIQATGQRSPLAAAASTLAIALLFNPLRRRLQAGIDRRFFRRKYDFALAVDLFSETLRDEVDLDRLEESLIGLLKDTLHPKVVALCSCIGVDSGRDTLFSAGDPVLPFLLKAQEAIVLTRYTMESPAISTLMARGIVLIMPMVSQGELVGLLSLGPSEADRPYSIDDRRLLSVLAGRAAPAMRIAQLAQEQRDRVIESQRMEAEMRVARLIQQTLIPDTMPALPGWDIQGDYRPARAVGGDFFDFIELEGGRLGLIIGDATGKGIPAALVMAAARSYIRTLALEHSSPGEVLRWANEFLCQEMPANMFVTALYAVIDLVRGTIVFANAGHNLPCLNFQGQVRELVARGMPLGLMPGMEYEETQASISVGETLLFYSDGLVEAHNPSSEMFGVPRLLKLMADLPGKSALIEGLLENWLDFRGGIGEQEDDMTLVVLRSMGVDAPVVAGAAGDAVAAPTVAELAEFM